MNQHVELFRDRLFAAQGFASAATRQSAHTVWIPTGQRYFGARVGESAGSAASGAATARNQHGGVRDAEVRRERTQDACDIGVCAAPLAGLLPNGIHGPDAARQRIDRIEVAHHLLFMRDRDAEPCHRQLFAKPEEIAQLRRGHQEWQIHRIHTAGLKRAIVNRGRYRMPHGIGDHAIDFAVLRELFHAIHMPQLARADLALGRALGRHGGGISEDTAEPWREHAAGKSHFPHRQHDHGRARVGPVARGNHGQDAARVRWLSSRRNHFVSVRGNACHAAQDIIELRGIFEIVIGNDQLRGGPESMETVGRDLRGFNLNVDGASALLNGEFEDAKLVVHSSVELAVILMTAAGGENQAIGKLPEKCADSLCAAFRIGQVVKTEFKECFTRLGFAACMVEKRRDVGKTEGNANAGKFPLLRHTLANAMCGKRIR